MSSSPSAAPSLNENHSAALRIWHWATFIVISASLITVLIASTLLSNKPGPPPSQQSVQNEQAQPPTADPAKAALKPIRQTLWTWHKYFGFVLAGLFLFRIMLEFFQPADEKILQRIKNARNYISLHPAEPADSKHYTRVKLLYLLFYTLLTVIVLTGLTLAFSKELGISKPIGSAVKETHEITMYLILTFIAIHLAGVVLGELGKYKGVVSSMINGGK